MNTLQYKLIILLTLSLVVLASGCTSNSGDTAKNFTNDQISFQYPGNWSEISEDQYTTYENESTIHMVHIEAQTIDSTTIIVSTVNRKICTTVNNSKDYYDLLVRGSSYSNGTNVSKSTITIDNTTAYVLEYTSSNKKTTTGTRKFKNIIFDKNGEIYVIVLTCFPETYDAGNSALDMITQSFKVK